MEPSHHASRDDAIRGNGALRRDFRKSPIAPTVVLSSRAERGATMATITANRERRLQSFGDHGVIRPRPRPTCTRCPEGTAMALLKAHERLAIARMCLDLARLTRRGFAPQEPFGNKMETFYVGLCVLIGHIDGKPFTVTKLSNYLEASRSVTLRRLDQLIEFGVVERRGNRYFINEEVANTKPAMDVHSALVRVVKDAAAQLDP
jgi:hypothetical protein